MKKRCLVNVSDGCGSPHNRMKVGIFVELECGEDGQPLDTPENQDIIKQVQDKHAPACR